MDDVFKQSMFNLLIGLLKNFVNVFTKIKAN